MYALAVFDLTISATLHDHCRLHKIPDKTNNNESSLIECFRYIVFLKNNSTIYCVCAKNYSILGEFIASLRKFSLYSVNYCLIVIVGK
jgi:hypothetical protein